MSRVWLWSSHHGYLKRLSNYGLNNQEVCYALLDDVFFVCVFHDRALNAPIIEHVSSPLQYYGVLC
jgi:hypothetical protein